MTSKRAAARRRRSSREAEKPLAWIGPDGLERTRVYEEVFIPQDDPWPRFTIIYPREPSYLRLTPEQIRASRRSTETFHRAMGVALGTAWIAATHLGYHETCKEKACMRMRRCAGRRHEEDWSTFPGPMYPPCVDKDTADEVRPISNELTAILGRSMGPFYVDGIEGPREALENIGLTRLPDDALDTALAQVERRRREREEVRRKVYGEKEAGAANERLRSASAGAKSFPAKADGGTIVPRRRPDDAA